MTLVFYDIAMAPPQDQNACFPNPSKTRLALNAKQIDYQTEWIHVPDIPKLRKSKKVAAVRTYADGTDFQTLPIIWDPSTQIFIGDSFDIAVYLERSYKSSGLDELFPSQALNYRFTLNSPLLIPLSEIKQDEYLEYRRFNNNVDALFTSYLPLSYRGMRFDPSRVEEVQTEFLRRTGASSWEAFLREEEPRPQKLAAFMEELGGLAATYEGTFVFGAIPCYADFIVGGWARLFKVCLDPAEWQQVAASNGGFLGKLSNSLEVYMRFE